MVKDIEIARRRLTALRDGISIHIDVVLFFPRKVPESNDFVCTFELVWPGTLRRHEVFGVDAFQAILLAMNTIAAELYVGPASKLDALTWLEKGDGFGFPLSAPLRDLARGDDRLL